MLVLNLTDNLNPDDAPDAGDRLYELARTKAKERYQRPPAVDLQLLEGWSHPPDNWYFSDKVWPDHRHFLAPTPPHGLAFANTPEALDGHPLSLASNEPNPNGGLPFYFLSRAASTVTAGGTGFAALEYFDQPMPKPRP